MKLAGLFSGIGGFELPFERRNHRSMLLCDIWDASRAVLGTHFSEAELMADISHIDTLHDCIDVVTAGFPCTDLSQAGRMAGINGKESGLVSHVFRLLKNKNIEWLVLENVRNMLVLDNGRAMSYMISNLEGLGFRWAYRLVDSRFSGIPQRRHRVIFVASRHNDPCEVLFSDDSGPIDESSLRDDMYGFYWTEGLTGLGWAKDAVPPLKGGSTVGIASPPGIWMRNAPLRKRFVTPSIEDAEALQGFPRGWTKPAQIDFRKNGPRWKLVGNAVTVGVTTWLTDRLCNPQKTTCTSERWGRNGKWPESAHGKDGEVWRVHASCYPTQEPYIHLSDLLTPNSMDPLSLRAASGFLSRTKRSNLRFNKDFIEDLNDYVEELTRA